MDLYETYFINKYQPIYNLEKVFNYPPRITLPELKPKVLLQDTGNLYSFYQKGNKEEQDNFEKNWRRAINNFELGIDCNEEGNIDFCYYLAIKNKN